MGIVKGVLVILLAGWVILTTIATLPMELEYKWQAWAIVTWGPVVVVAGLWEIVERIFFKGRGLMYDKYHIDHCDALEYLFNNWGTFPDTIPEGGPTRDISIAYFKTWRFVRTPQGEIVFGNCISPGVTRQEFESYVEKVGI